MHLSAAPEKDFSYRQEINRKLLHLSSLWMPLAIFYLDRSQAIALLGAAFAAMLGFEVLRRQSHGVAGWLNRYFSPIIRGKECAPGFCLTGATYMLAAACTVCVFFSQPIAIISLSIMLIADSAAALIGRRYGKRRILDKSLEGCAAFLLTALLTVMVISLAAGFPHRVMVSGLFACLIATGAELISGALRLDDNLTITLASACTMLLIMNSF